MSGWRNKTNFNTFLVKENHLILSCDSLEGYIFVFDKSIGLKVAMYDMTGLNNAYLPYWVLFN